MAAARGQRPGVTGARRPPTRAERAELAGTYRIARRTFAIVDVDGRLERRLGNAATPVLMTGTDQLTVVTSRGDVVEHRVVRDAAGKIHYLFDGQTAFPRAAAP